MNRELLEQLLRDADACDASPAVDANLVARVQARAKRQQRVRAIGGSAIATVCTATIIAWALRPDAHPSSAARIAHATQPSVPLGATTTTSIDDARAELLALSQEADRLAAAAEAAWAAERPARRPAKRASTLVFTDVAAQVERAAFTMVYQAARMPSDGGASSPAAGVYRQAAQSFPHTPSGELARRRLNELEHRKDG